MARRLDTSASSPRSISFWIVVAVLAVVDALSIAAVPILFAADQKALAFFLIGAAFIISACSVSGASAPAKPRQDPGQAGRPPAAPEADEGLDEDPIVAELVAICREVSKDRQIGADDNLFEVGVSSLTLTEIVLAVDERFPGKLDISDLFDYPTLREIAALLKRGT